MKRQGTVPRLFIATVITLLLCAGAAQAQSALDARLERRIAILAFYDTPLPEVLAFLDEQISEESVITADPELDLGKLQVSVQLNEIRIRSALNLVLRPRGLDYSIQDGRLVVSTPVQFRDAGDENTARLMDPAPRSGPRTRQEETLEALDRTLDDVVFDDMPLAELPGIVSRLCYPRVVNVVLDPALDAGAIRLNAEADDERMADFLRDALDSQGLAYAVWSEAVFISRPERLRALTNRGMGRIQLATRPVGENSVELIWEINGITPHDARQHRTYTSAFSGETEPLDGLTFRVLSARHGEAFEAVGTVKGPANRFRHVEVEPGILRFYQVVALDDGGAQVGQSDAVPGAAGPNLLAVSDFEALQPGLLEDAVSGGGSQIESGAFYVVEGARPWSDGRRILEGRPAEAGKRKAACRLKRFRVSSERSYLHGAWLRAPGRMLLFGRRYHDAQGETHICGYAVYPMSDAPQWHFITQLVEPDPKSSRTAYRTMMDNFWEFPAEAAFMSTWIICYDMVSVDDMWVVEVAPLTLPSGATEPDAKAAE